MPRRFTMGTLVSRCRLRVDMRKNQARTDADFKTLISEQYGELWGVVSDTGCRYFETSTTITATGAASYTEPTDHLSSVRVAHVLPDGREEPLYELEARDEWKLKGLTGVARHYALVDDQIFLYPRPLSGTYKLYYLQQAPDLSQYGDDDVVDVVNPDGEAFLIWGVAVKIHGELEGNAMLALRERDAARERLHWWAIQRALNAPHRRVVESDPFTEESTWNPAGFWNRPP